MTDNTKYDWWDDGKRPPITMRLPRARKPGVSASMLWYGGGSLVLLIGLLWWLKP